MLVRVVMEVHLGEEIDQLGIVSSKIRKCDIPWLKQMRV